MNKILWENIFKNLIILFILAFFYSQIENFFLNFQIAGDKSVLGSVLVAVSILIVTASFGCFAFTYEKAELSKFGLRLLAHTTTGVLMLLIGLSLEMTSIIARLLMGNFYIFDFSLILLFVGIILYDFWDLRRAKV